MRFVMKQKIISWGDDFTIKDESGRPLFVVDGKALSWGDQLSFRDMHGNELAYIKEEVFAWGKTYEVYRNDAVAAVVKKKLFSLFKCRFTVDVPGPDDLEATGDLLDHEYEFKRGDRTVASVSKRWFTWTDTYGIDIADGEDVVLLLASAVVVDLACHGSWNSDDDD